MAALSEASGNAQGFTFSPTTYEFPSLSSSDAKTRILRWGMEDHLKVMRFKFSGRFRNEAATDFLTELFRSPEASALATSMGPLSVPATSTLAVEKLACTVLNMGFFDILVSEDLMGENGYIKKCMTERFDSVDADNLILEMLLNPESENASVFTSEQKTEFIFHLFATILVGGVMHQRDDYCNEYLETTRALYKELLTVHKSNRTGKVEVSSQVYRVLGGEGCSIFPHESGHNRCYVVVDAVKKYATVIYLPWMPFW